MKTINTFIIEKLKITKDSKLKQYYNPKTFTIDLPKCSDPFNEDIDFNGPVWKTLELPQHRLVIYKDAYRDDKPHLTDICDLLGCIMIFQDDYENFDYKKDILYSSDDIHDILRWYFIHVFKIDLNHFPDKYKDIDDWAHFINSNINTSVSCDNLYNLGEFYRNEDNYYSDQNFDKKLGKNINYDDPQLMLKNTCQQIF